MPSALFRVKHKQGNTLVKIFDKNVFAGSL